MKHLGTKSLETPHLFIRPFKLEYAKDMYQNWANDNEVTKFLTWQPHKDIAESEELTKGWIESYKNDDYYLWAIVLKEIDQAIGSISVVNKNDKINMVTIGYCIGKKWWGEGIMTETLSEVIRFFFEEVGINRIELAHDPHNPASGKVMQKCGLINEGTLRQADINNQGLCDLCIHSILAEDYFKNKKPTVI